jgi:hypothetical protein
MFFLIRVIIGLLFIISGGEKLLWPYQNFLYVLESYNLLPTGLEFFVARTFPWIEFLTGVLMLLGLWLPQMIKISLAMFAVFILVIGQALIRQLPIDDCGCFGNLISLKPQHTLIMDSLFFLGLIGTLRNIKNAEILSLDRYFRK